MPTLADVRLRQGLLLGRMRNLGFTVQESVTLEALTEEVEKSSAIEGESLNSKQVRSSIPVKLGLESASLPPD